MPGLTDMEELLQRISDKTFVDYMREAIACYHVGANRGCIVMSYIALFEDVRQKLRELAKVNSVAKSISTEVEKRAESQEIFEKYMIDKLKAEGLINGIDADRLDQIRVSRNKAAHPSGVQASPEEARFVFFEVIDKFLSKQVLKTTHAVDRLIERLKNNNFFPSVIVDEMVAIVAQELEALHPSSMPYLVHRLSEAWASSETVLKRNAGTFLIAYEQKNEGSDDQLVAKTVIIPRLDDDSQAPLLGPLIAANVVLIKDLDNTAKTRLQQLLIKACQELDTAVPPNRLVHPVRLLIKADKHLGSEFMPLTYPEYCMAVIEKYLYVPTLVDLIKKSDILVAKLLKEYKNNAGSTNFDTANNFVNKVADLDGVLGSFIHPKDAFEIIVAINKAADHGAFASMDLRSAKFVSTPNLVSLARQYIDQEKSAAEEYLGLSLIDGTLEGLLQHLTITEAVPS